MPRLEVLVQSDDGNRVIVNCDRPATLMAFGDTFDKELPTNVREVAWLAHNALKIDEPLDDWIESVDWITLDPDDVEEAVKDGVARPTQKRATKSVKRSPESQ